MKPVKNASRGFSLVELLIVLAIIVTLTSVVLVSVQAVRNKGFDNALKSMMKQAANQAENYRTSTPNLDFGKNISSLAVSDCQGGVFDDPDMNNLEQGMLKNAMQGATLSCTTDVSGANWSLMVSALHGGGPWCVDSQGGFKASLVNTGGVCN